MEFAAFLLFSLVSLFISAVLALLGDTVYSFGSFGGSIATPVILFSRMLMIAAGVALFPLFFTLFWKLSPKIHAFLSLVLATGVGLLLVTIQASSPPPSSGACNTLFSSLAAPGSKLDLSLRKHPVTGYTFASLEDSCRVLRSPLPDPRPSTLAAAGAQYVSKIFEAHSNKKEKIQAELAAEAAQNAMDSLKSLPQPQSFYQLPAPGTLREVEAQLIERMDMGLIKVAQRELERSEEKLHQPENLKTAPH